MKKTAPFLLIATLGFGYFMFVLLSNDLKTDLSAEQKQTMQLSKKLKQEQEKNEELVSLISSKEDEKKVPEKTEKPIEQNYDEEIKTFLEAMYNYDNTTNRKEKLETLVTDTFKSYLDTISGDSSIEYQSTLKKYDIYKTDLINKIAIIRVHYDFKVGEGEAIEYDNLITLQFIEEEGVMKVDKQSIESIQKQNKMKQW